MKRKRKKPLYSNATNGKTMQSCSATISNPMAQRNGKKRFAKRTL
jgi:hypothetical protein